MPRQTYEVRVREQLSPNKWVKKSKFISGSDSQDAANKYKGGGHVMWVQKVSRERLLGIGEFFKMGPELLRDLQKGGSLSEEVSVKKEIDRNTKKNKAFSRRRLATEE
jgi:hypothetical protein